MHARLKERRSLERVRLDRPPPTETSSAFDNQRVLSPERLEHIPISELKIPTRVLKNHPRSQIKQIGKSYQIFGYLVPIVVDRDNVIRAGIARFLAAKDIGMKAIPAIRIGNLSEAELRAFQLADNKLAEKSKWNREGLALEIPELRDLLISDPAELSLEDIGFEPSEVDQIILDGEAQTSDPADGIEESENHGPPVTVRGDIWIAGNHRIICGDSRDQDVLSALMEGRFADMAITDPPYIQSVVPRRSAEGIRSGPIAPEHRSSQSIKHTQRLTP